MAEQTPQQLLHKPTYLNCKIQQPIDSSRFAIPTSAKDWPGLVGQVSSHPISLLIPVFSAYHCNVLFAFNPNS